MIHVHSKVEGFGPSEPGEVVSATGWSFVRPGRNATKHPLGFKINRNLFTAPPNHPYDLNNRLVSSHNHPVVLVNQADVLGNRPVDLNNQPVE